jgi:hypothetical protein
MDELVERVRQALAGEYPGAPNGRVRDVPDRRAIRWYTTIGLVDRPLGMRGRTALYGPRHLQQLVAIKRRQAEGRSLAQIQAEFTWLTPEGLSDASRVPDDLLAAADGVEPDEPGAVRPRFWTADPTMSAPVPDGGNPPRVASPTSPVHGAAPPVHGAAPPVHGAAPPAHGAAPPAHGTASPVHGAAPPAHGVASPVHGVALGGGAILLVPHPVNDRDRAEIASAAAPLLDLLETRGLIDGRTP